MSEVTNLPNRQAEITELEAILNTPTIVESICNWNKARYDQVFDDALQASLLTEELKELNDAFKVEDKVEVADACADIFYVAIGGLWKAGESAEGITSLVTTLEAKIQDMIPPVGLAIAWHTMMPNRLSVSALVACAACAELVSFLLSLDETHKKTEQDASIAAFKIIRAVCVSNDTKEVKRTASDIKANTTKGSAYVSPTATIETILAKWEA